jgi:prepilin-type N-terminal cleavage/methylation domain-containing protein
LQGDARREELSRLHKLATARKGGFGRMVKQRGFTLVELAVVMVITGLAAGSVANAARISAVQKKLDVTRGNIETVKQALNRYKAEHGGVYPCPASKTAVFGSYDFGRSDDCQAHYITMGQCDAGLCVRAGRAYDHDSNPGTPDLNNRVRVGAVPAQALDLPFDVMRDGYGNLIEYVVSESFVNGVTVPTGSAILGGAIDVTNSTGDNVLAVPQTAEWVLLSHGRNGAGATVFGTGKVGKACIAGSAEWRNCNWDIANQPARFVTSQLSAGDAAYFYDDILVFSTKPDAVAAAGATVSLEPLVVDGAACPDDYDTAFVGDRVYFLGGGGTVSPCAPVSSLRVCYGGSNHSYYPCASGGAAMSASTNYDGTFGYFHRQGIACSVCVPKT